MNIYLDLSSSRIQNQSFFKKLRMNIIWCFAQKHCWTPRKTTYKSLFTETVLQFYVSGLLRVHTVQSQAK